MARRSSRATAGQLPARYRNDFISISPEPRTHQDSVASFSASSSSQSNMSSLAQSLPSGRPRGRRPSRNMLKPEAANDQLEIGRIHPVYPTAAFPTREFPPRKPTSTMGGKRSDTKRDSMDARFSPKDQRNKRIHGKGYDDNDDANWYFLDGTYMDKNGNAMHFIARYYDEHAEEYEAYKKDSQGDMKDKNTAFSSFLETPEYEEASQHRTKEAIMQSFEKWRAHGGASLVTGKGDSEDGDAHHANFKDEKFAALHFKLQWHLISEVEEDLTLHPPRHIPTDAGGRPYRLTRILFGLTSPLVVRELERKVEEAKNKPELMPQPADYAKAKAYLLEKGLPVTLLDLYDYLDT